MLWRICLKLIIKSSFLKLLIVVLPSQKRVSGRMLEKLWMILQVNLKLDIVL